VLKGDKPITERPGSLLKEADLAATRDAEEKKLVRKLDDAEFASYLMYPKVFSDFNALPGHLRPGLVLPTPVLFAKGTRDHDPGERGKGRCFVGEPRKLAG
jgi:pyruvate carboxylase